MGNILLFNGYFLTFDMAFEIKHINVGSAIEDRRKQLDITKTELGRRINVPQQLSLIHISRSSWKNLRHGSASISRNASATSAKRKWLTDRWYMTSRTDEALKQWHK